VGYQSYLNTSSWDTERLRITPTPYHDGTLIDFFARALVEVWSQLGLPVQKSAIAAE